MIDIKQHITNHWNQLKQFNLFVACSGGLDSMVLLHALIENGHKPNVIHVNYQLRGNDSELDAKFVENFCRAHHISFEIKTIHLKDRLSNGGNLQEMARDVRYQWFKEILSDSGNRVVLAHHLDDQVETFFLNLSRKSGVMGLAGMLSDNDGIIRPLLEFSKKELTEYSLSKGIIWREDVSNSSNKYRRNLLRNLILPELMKTIPTLKESVSELIHHFQNKQIELEIEIDPLIQHIKDKRSLHIDTFLKLDEFQKNEFCRRLNQKSDLARRLDQLVSSAKGKKIELNNGPFEEIIKIEDAFYFVDSKGIDRIRDLKIENVKSLPNDYSKETIYLDRSKINGELKVRNWEIGDRMSPLGMKGSKLISDIIAESDLDPLQKRNVQVLHDDMDILWCAGLKIGRKALADKTTMEIIKCSFE